MTFESIDSFLSSLQNTFYAVYFSEWSSLLIAALFFSLLNYSQRSLILTWLVRLPFTLLHEWAHFLVALILNGKPSGFKVLPKKEGGAVVLGTVDISNPNAFNAFPISFAPVLLLVLSYQASLIFATEYDVNPLSHFFYVGFQTLLIMSAFPSRQDWKVALSYPVGFLGYVGLIAAMIWLYAH